MASDKSTTLEKALNTDSIQKRNYIEDIMFFFVFFFVFFLLFVYKDFVFLEDGTRFAQETEKCMHINGELDYHLPKYLST